MYFHQRFIPDLAIYSYLIGDERTGEAAVIDSTRDVDEFLRSAERENFHIRHILETHVHADFVSGSRELKTRLGGEPTIHVSGLGGQDWTPPYGDYVLKDGNEIRMATSASRPSTPPATRWSTSPGRSTTTAAASRTHG